MLPQFFERLIEEGLLQRTDVHTTRDGFCAAFKPLSELLAQRQVYVVPGEQGQMLRCENYFDDWHLYAVLQKEEWVYSLFKLREQEFDIRSGLQADGDAPGVTISFVAFDVELLRDCLQTPTQEKAKKLAAEINRVVAKKGQKHHPGLKAYFVRPEAQGACLAAELYIRHIVSFAREGTVAVPEHYALLCAKRKAKKYRRLPEFIESNNAAAERVVCDHEKIYLRDAEKPDRFEKQAILATHTGNTSFRSFAAEVRFHALFLMAVFKVRIPFLRGSVYESAIRADMSVQDSEMQGPKPYYRENSRLVQRQGDGSGMGE